jgi:hypothetical protein
MTSSEMGRAQAHTVITRRVPGSRKHWPATAAVPWDIVKLAHKKDIPAYSAGISVKD